MKHIEYWVAEDGTEFSSETECEEHELKRKLLDTELRVICPETNSAYFGPLIIEQEVHNQCDCVIVRSTKALEDLQAIQKFTGFYDGIDGLGEWKYDDCENKWTVKS